MRTLAIASCQDYRARVLCAVSMLLAAVPVSTGAAVPLPLRDSGIGTFAVAYGNQTARATQLTQSYDLMLCADSINIAPLRAADPSKAILGYLDTNLQWYNPWFAEVQRSEPSFLHSADPASLTAHTAAGSVTLSWVADRRADDGTIALGGYNVHRRMSGTTGAFTLLTPSPIAATSYTDLVADGTLYDYTVTSVDQSFGDLPYSEVVCASAGATSAPFVAPSSVTVTPGAAHATVAITVTASPGVSSATLWMDTDRDLAFEAGESVAMTPAGTDAAGNALFSCTRAVPPTYVVGVVAGYAWYASATAGGTTVRTPASGSYTTNVNNRIRGQAFAVWLMDPADSTWQRLLANGVRTLSSVGYDGILLDDCYGEARELNADGEVRRSVSMRWRTSMQDLITVLSAAGRPGALLINSFSDATMGYVDASDGGMAEGFTVAPWKTIDASSGWWWEKWQNDGLRAQAGPAATQLYLALGPPDDTRMRFYSLASYLLIKDERAYFAYERAGIFNDPQYFPEFDLAVGAPLESFSAMEQALRPSGLYGRRFENALVLVNASPTQSLSETLPGTYALVSATGTEVPSFGGNGAVSARWVSSITLAPMSGAILMSTWNGSINTPAVTSGEGGSGAGSTVSLALAPNPATGVCRLTVSLAQREDLRVAIYDAKGRRVAECVNERAASGFVNRSIDVGALRLPNGTFTVIAETPHGRVARPLIVARSGAQR